MTTKIINDPASLQRLGMLAESMQRRADLMAFAAEKARAAGNVHDAHDAQQAANNAAWVAYRVRGYMATISGLTVADVEPQAIGLADACAATDEPPSQIVGFVAWLRRLVGHMLPWVSAETWQTCGSLMLMDRARSQGRLP